MCLHFVEAPSPPKHGINTRAATTIKVYIQLNGTLEAAGEVHRPTAACFGGSSSGGRVRRAYLGQNE